MRTRPSLPGIAAGSKQAPIVLDEAAVRDALGRQRFYQEAAERTAVPGVATGLAVTGTGGDVLFVEATTMKGKDGLVLTGQLGDVMKESAQAALSFARAYALTLGLGTEFYAGREIHIHVPSGAVPKDGPSAGVAMACALVSLISGVPVRHDVAMTGELTLRGKVLPIGGLKEKLLAATRMGITTCIIPAGNAPELSEIPPHVMSKLTVKPVRTVDEALEIALVRRLERKEAFDDTQTGKAPAPASTKPGARTRKNTRSGMA